MKIFEIKNKNLWESFLFNSQEKTFLSSWNWGEFQKRMGNKIWRLGVFNQEELVGTSLVVKVEAKRGKFLFLPHNPNLKKDDYEIKFEVLKILLENLKELAKKEKIDFIRISPVWPRTRENEKIFELLNFKKAPIHIHPEITWELNIEPSEEEILRGMRKTTRYLIKKCEEEKRIEIKEENNLKGLEKFYQIYTETQQRHSFVPFSFQYLKEEFLSFLPDNQISIILAYYQGKVLSGGIFVFWQNTCFYHHGASSKLYQKIPTSYLLLWQAIKLAKIRGCKKFNFWGISESNNPKHPWAGLTFFKKGFGGTEKAFVKTRDFIISFRYWLNFLVEKVRKIKRGY